MGKLYCIALHSSQVGWESKNTSSSNGTRGSYEHTEREYTRCGAEIISHKGGMNCAARVWGRIFTCWALYIWKCCMYLVLLRNCCAASILRILSQYGSWGSPIYVYMSNHRCIEWALRTSLRTAILVQTKGYCFGGLEDCIRSHIRQNGLRTLSLCGQYKPAVIARFSLRILQKIENFRVLWKLKNHDHGS